ncbi:MAG TPA: nucleotide exchange factor GrpE [Solirubrobacteraceae bacterium]|nr:nucleotide exchange factor GrpE [Solirubrobacteraceae bacterium]
MAEERAFGVGEAVEDADSPAQAPNEIELELAGDQPAEVDGGEAEVDGGEAPELDELAATAAQRDEYLALAQRTQADFENYRKRVAREAGVAEGRGLTRLARELLPALDNLDRALAHAADADADAALIDGLRLVQRELLGALERVGVTPFGEAGEQFDPELHEAVAQQPFEGRAPGEIGEVYQSGYRLAGGVIRPARVLVAG